ncbi:thyroid peroxidase-like [Mercenaria mercenaria]|uniref:thyroid peroxidase-like n=1 Tax=Mercenaria mercenaria TaxID=6596 RepID=UPI00234ECC9E|nr:thyroid peroxidase-like [Mercenaria mercenaria]
MDIEVFLLYSLAVLTAICVGHAAFSERTADNQQASSLTVERVEDALRRAKEINLLQRTINKVDRELNSDKSYRCPLSLHHGKRVSSNSEDYSKTKDALLALRILMKEGGFSPEDLQTREAISIFSRAEGMNCDLPDPGTCDFYSKYRTINGSCNNKDNPRWGMTGTIQERILKSDYDSLPGDPRTTGIDGKPLPNPRFISNAVHANPSPLESLSRTNTLLLFAFGQFLDHDIALTPESEDIDCCKSDDNQDNCFNLFQH